MYVVDDLECIETIDRESLKERSDKQFIHEYKFITNKKDEKSDFTYVEFDSNVKFLPGNIYHIAFIEYDIETHESSEWNVREIIGVFNDIVKMQKTISAVKDDLRKNPGKPSQYVVDDEEFATGFWKNPQVDVLKISSVSLKYKHEE